MRLWSILMFTILLFAMQAALYSRQSVVSWRDPSPHTVRFVTVENGVRIEVLDWGGTGQSLVFLAGGGNTAHVFDDFAPKFTGTYHVYGITRRGFGASGFSESEVGINRLRSDVLGVLAALEINRPVLVGHSIAGAELSAIATSYPERVASLIYLEAGYPYAFNNGTGPTMKEFEGIEAPDPPNPSNSDLTSFVTLQRWDSQTFGFSVPEAEFRQTWETTSDGRPVKPRGFPGSRVFMTILRSDTQYRDIALPALVIFAVPHIPERYITSTTNPSVRETARAYFAKIDVLTEKQASAFESGVPKARVVRLKGGHYIFSTNEQDVIREMRAFLGGLR